MADYLLLLFSTWEKVGVIAIVQEASVEKTRLKSGRKVWPTAGIIDAQSVKFTFVIRESKSFDTGKKVKGIRWHIITDTLGLVLAIVIQSTSVQGSDGAAEAIGTLRKSWRSIIKLFADGGYLGKLITQIKADFKIEMETIKRNELHTFKILLRKRDRGKNFFRTRANRRNSKNYERLNNTGAAMVHLTSIKIMLNRF